MNIANTLDFAWQAEFGCEGGPVIVANLDDFLAWRGAEPLPPSQATELHLWGQFTAELPDAWRPNGSSGHQYIADANPAQRREALVDLVLARWPGSTIERGVGQWRITRPDGKLMRIALAPDSEYDRAIRGFEREGLHTFGQGAIAYLWDARPGMVGIRVGLARTSLVLAQVEFAEDDAGAARAYAHAYAHGCGKASVTPGSEKGMRYRITQGQVVAAWSPNGAQHLEAPIGPADAATGTADRVLDFAIEASGALTFLEPGWYASSVHYHEDANEDWGVSWCVLQRT